MIALDPYRGEKPAYDGDEGIAISLVLFRRVVLPLDVACSAVDDEPRLYSVVLDILSSVFHSSVFFGISSSLFGLSSTVDKEFNLAVPYWRLGWTSTSNPAKPQDPPRTIDIAHKDLHVTSQNNMSSQLK